MATPSGSKPSSRLQEYTANYGQRLQSLLVPTPNTVTDTSAVGVQSPLEQQPAQSQQQPQPQMSPVQQPSTSMLDEQPAQSPVQKGTTVRDSFKGMPDEEQKKQADDLEAALSKGNKTIDGAYDEMIKQMGTRPDEGLSREDKSMLLIEFGLNLMKNSSGKDYGQDLGGALGEAGLNSMDSYQRTKGAKARQYDARRSALEEGRAKEKMDLGLEASKEEIKNDATLPRQFAPLSSKIEMFPGGDGFMYQNINGKNTIAIDDATGKPIRATEKDLKTGGGDAKPKDYEFDHRYDRYMEIHGKDKDGKELTGERLQKVKRDALSYAGDQKGASLSEAEIRQTATRAIDDHMRFFADQYRDYSPAQLEAERAQLVEKRVKEMRSGRDNATIDQEPPPPRAPVNSAFAPYPSKGGSAFETNPVPASPPADALVAGRARKIKGFDGRWTLVNGQPKRVD